MLHSHLEKDGFALHPAVFSSSDVQSLLVKLERALVSLASSAGIIRGQTGGISGARNLLQSWPAVADVWRKPVLLEAVTDVLGNEAGLVRVLFFDKPPEQTWSLPWHKDMTIAVQDNTLPSPHFSKPTRKAGISHVEAPQMVLEAMLTARIHLDQVTEENGPLKVIPGSHRQGKAPSDGNTLPVFVLAEQGDVLLMRPLLEHASGRSIEGTKRHRRILHLEFAASAELPDGYRWHDFIKCH